MSRGSGERERENRKARQILTMLTSRWQDGRTKWFLSLSRSFSVFFKISTQNPPMYYPYKTGSFPLWAGSSLISFVWQTIRIYLSCLLFPTFPLSQEQIYPHALLLIHIYIPGLPFPSQELLLPRTKQGSLPFVNQPVWFSPPSCSKPLSDSRAMIWQSIKNNL